MHVSHETPQQTSTRLGQVIAKAELVIYDQPYAFVETAVSSFPQELLPTALAFVRDENVWSALVPGATSKQEQFVVFRFRFTPGLDNSGFVGWLASHLKAAVGTGVEDSSFSPSVRESASPRCRRPRPGMSPAPAS